MKSITIHLLLLISIMLSACGGGTPTETVERTREYVGEISGTEFFVAIAIDPNDGVLAYVCDGMGTDYLFRGTLEGDHALNLTSESGGGNLQARPDGDGYAGTFAIDGSSYPFTAVPASDYGGLYRVTGLSETHAEGTSQGGSVLNFDLLPDKSGVQIEVVTIDGNTFSANRFWTEGHDQSTPTEYREHWVILLNDGRGNGGRIKSSFQTDLRAVDPIEIP